jgi:hypothetical protein
VSGRASEEAIEAEVRSNYSKARKHAKQFFNKTLHFWRELNSTDWWSLCAISEEVHHRAPPISPRAQAIEHGQQADFYFNLLLDVSQAPEVCCALRAAACGLTTLVRVCSTSARTPILWTFISATRGTLWNSCRLPAMCVAGQACLAFPLLRNTLVHSPTARAALWAVRACTVQNAVP